MTTGTPDPVRTPEQVGLLLAHYPSGGGEAIKCACGWFSVRDVDGNAIVHWREHLNTLEAALSLSPASAFVPVQKCPVCDGQGHLNKPPQVPGDQPTWTSSSTASHPCHRCKGVGTVAMSPASEAQGEEKP